MIMRKIVFLSSIAALLLCLMTVQAQTLDIEITERERPEEWKSLVVGAQFKDRFLHMPVGTKTSKDNWGADAVMNRYIDNGIEDKERSYWCGTILHKDNRYHMYVVGWPESSEKGHMEWPNSIVYHTISDKPEGPYSIIDTIGAGHNAELFQAKDGTYVIFVTGGSYRSKSHMGPWKFEKMSFDPRDRKIIEGLSNLTFAKREDGSQLMVCRGGGVWFSEDGLSTFYQVTDKRVYPAIEGEFEDPVVWKDEVQYHLIVNDWYGRIAFYQRSKDGVNWVTDPGEAYVPGIARHADGEVEDWFKFERIKVLQDKYGRAYQANFAVIDTIKWEDLGNDKYSSKHIMIPLNKGVLLRMLNKTMPKNGKDEVRLLIRKEEGFDPVKDIDLSSLRFGISEEVNFGRGSKALRIDKHTDGAVVTFAAEGHQLNNEDFAPKLIGKDKRGELLFGFTRVPWITYEAAILSSRKPVVTADNGNLQAEVKIENFGIKSSKKGRLKLFVGAASERLLGEQVIPALKSYESNSIIFRDLPAESKENGLRVVIEEDGKVHQDIVFSKENSN